MSVESQTRLSLPAIVLLERRMISRSFWSMPSWYLYTVAVGENLAASRALSSGGAAAAGNTDKGDLFAWSGFQLTLYKDACERYWHALIGDKPLVYVVCREDAGESDSSDPAGVSIHPVIVTVDYDEATACAETDELVLTTTIPTDLYRYMEDFVLQHYKPKEFKKRKRKKWSDNPSAGELFQRGGADST